MKKTFINSMIGILFVVIGGISGGSYSYYLSEKRYGQWLKETEMSIYFQSYKKHEEIYASFESGNVSEAMKTLRSRMEFELSTLDWCVKNSCIQFKNSGLNPEWMKSKSSNKELKIDAQRPRAL